MPFGADEQFVRKIWGTPTFHFSTTGLGYPSQLIVYNMRAGELSFTISENGVEAITIKGTSFPLIIDKTLSIGSPKEHRKKIWTT